MSSFYSDLLLHHSSRLFFLSCLVFSLLSGIARSVVLNGTAQAVDLVFPVFNDTMFSCTGMPAIVGYKPCTYLSDGGVDFLPPRYNNIYPNQSGRMVYRTPIALNIPNHWVKTNFSTFFIFQVSHVPNKSELGAGIAFIITPTIGTPEGSEGGGLGLYANDSFTTVYKQLSPMVTAIEFDTSFTPGVDTEGVGVPHVGLDMASLRSSKTAAVGPEFLDAPVGMWIDYNDNLMTLSIYCTPVGTTNANAASLLKPTTPLIFVDYFTVESLSQTYQRMYIGMSGGIEPGGWEYNRIYYWRFTTNGFPPQTVTSAWYIWYGKLSTTSKIAVILGSLFGTIGGAYGCSECFFFLFFTRIKNPVTPSEKAWPIRRRTSLPGTRTKKERPPRKKVRDSLSVASPLYLWGAPAEPDWRRHEESPKSLGVDLSKRPEVELSDDEAPLILPMPAIEEGYEEESEADLKTQIDSAKSQDTDTPAKVASEEGERPGQELEHGSMGVQVAVSQPGERLSEVLMKPRKVSASARDKEQAEVKLEPLLAARRVAVPLMAKQQSPKKKSELGTNMELEGEMMAAHIERRVAPHLPAQPAQKSPSAPGKAISVVGRKPLQGEVQTPSATERRVTFEAAKGRSPVKETPLPTGKIGSPPPAQPSSSPKLEPLLAEKEVSPRARQPSPGPKQKSLPSEKTGSPPPSSSTKLEPLPEEKEVSPRARQPSSGPRQGSLPSEKTRSPPPAQPSSSPKLEPLPAEKEVPPRARQPSSGPRQSSLPSEKTRSPPPAQPSSSPKLEPLPAQKEVSPGARQPSSGPRQKSLPSEKTGSPPPAQPSLSPKLEPLPAEKEVPPRARQPSSVPRQTSLPSEKTRSPPPAEPSSSPKLKPLPSEKEVSPRARQPSLGPRQKSLPSEKTGSSQPTQPSPKQGPLPSEKKVSPWVIHPSSPLKQTPMPTQKKMSPWAMQPSSPPKQTSLPGEKKVYPWMIQPSSRPKHAPWEAPQKIGSSRPSQPSTSPKLGPLPLETIVSPRTIPASSLTKQRQLPAEKIMSPRSILPSSVLKQGPLQGEKKAAQQARRQMGAPHQADQIRSPQKLSSPVGIMAAPQKSPGSSKPQAGETSTTLPKRPLRKGPELLQIPKFKQLKAPRSSPLTSPRTASPLGSPSAKPRPSPLSSPKNPR